MTFWTLLFAGANTLLCIRLLFFSDKDRQLSHWIYRVMLFLVAIYVGRQVIYIVFFPNEPVSAWAAIFHVGLFIGALFMRPEYLPGNCSYDTTKRAYLELGYSATRAWFRVWHPQLYGSGAKYRARTR